LFSGKATAPLFGMAFSTVLLVIGSETSRFAGDAGSKVYTRIVQLTVAVVYVVVAFGLLEYFKKQGKQDAKSE
jgi:small neutral amino acid transporter SnatA (MarC family)